MKIGLDARQLSRPLTGMGRYTLEICQSLSKIKGISLYLYSPADLRFDFRGLEQAHVRTKNWDAGILRQFWTETFLPFWAARDRVDIFWGPAHRIPRFLPDTMARVVTIHDLVWKYASDTMPPLRKKLEQIQTPSAIAHADWIVTDASATAAALKDEYPASKNKISVIHLGVTYQDCLVSKKDLEPLGIDQNYFLFVGTLEPRKNLLRLLTSYSRFSASMKDKALLVIAGGKGWGGVDIKKTVRELDLERHVRLVGYVDDAMLAALYKHALFLAMPSIYEGFGLPLTEAMAHGTPVLTSDNSSMPEVAGEAGLLVDPLSGDSIQEGLMELISNDKLRKRLASHAKDSAKRFDWDVAAAKLVDVFKKAVDARRK
ncbi:MAG: glycosyltransferase family 1 protein [Smithellaceae bacterium]|jgi:glycosyltransferase involved in cell wall biosynthesis